MLLRLRGVRFEWADEDKAKRRPGAQFGLIGCGPQQDRYPVVVGENPRIAWWVWLMAVFVLIVVWMIARWLV